MTAMIRSPRALMAAFALLLVPMFGLGLNGLWCAFHGEFPPRLDVEARANHAEVVTSEAPIDKNDHHG